MKAYCVNTVGKSFIMLLCAMLVLGAAAPSQAQRREMNGEVILFDEPNNLIVIDDEDVLFDRSRITVYYMGEVVDSHYMRRGIRIRYNLHPDGYMNEVHLLGPRNVLVEMMKS